MDEASASAAIVYLLPVSNWEEGVAAGNTPDIKLGAAAESGYGLNSTFPIKESVAWLSSQEARGRNLNNERETRSWEGRKARVSSETGVRTNRSFKETYEKDFFFLVSKTAEKEQVKRWWMLEEKQEEPRGGWP
ncbi:hypothetical protein Nepgr_016403 [Nepenthes gracilis]|uniref:Uncharacterized protein n=1 Tax=Nepenthes gracilis TaxID=150966 RepID=A0AAD3XRA1_NEPGR|nr:hypothetical protein Nepgr_016403 [Nepenthes gracilis]